MRQPDITILGQTPSQKNNKQIFISKRTGKRFITNSKTVKRWQQDALWQLKGIPPVSDYPVAMHVKFYMKDNIRRDMDNQLSSIQDILITSGILKDDSWQQLRPVSLDAELDQLNPRAEIWFSYSEDVPSDWSLQSVREVNIEESPNG